MHIVIIGNGIAGSTLARNIRKSSDAKITMISKESKYFFSRTALMYVYMGHMQFEQTQPYENHFWKKNKINLIHDEVVGINSSLKQITLKGNAPILYDKLVFAVGSSPNKFGWPGQDLYGVQGLYSKQDLESMEASTKSSKSAVVVGGGLIGIEMAEMLLSRGIHVHYLVRESHFWGNVLPQQDAQLIMNHLERHHGLTMYYQEELGEILPNQTNGVRAIKTKSGLEIDCEFVGLAVGVHANLDLAKTLNLETNKGILVNEYFETSIRDIYAIGDCVELRSSIEGRRNIEQVWYVGKIMGEHLTKTLLGKPTQYHPGYWFNSAKFFDIEYQTYGNVSSKLKEDEEEFIWKHPTMEVMLHFVFDKKSLQFVGVNTFGLRLRHEIFDHWLRSSATMDEVIQHLELSFFDPEFYINYYSQILNAYNQYFGKNIEVGKKRWWQSILN